MKNLQFSAKLVVENWKILVIGRKNLLANA